MTVLNPADAVTVEEVTPDEGRALFHRACLREFGVSADVFLAHYESGSLPPEWAPEAIQRAEFLLPFAR